MIVCIKHPKYDGVASPILSCKTCCNKFIAAIKERASAQPQVQPSEAVGRP